MVARSRVARTVPGIAVALGLGWAALFGGLQVPAVFIRAVLVAGVLCPLVMELGPVRPTELAGSLRAFGAAMAVQFVLGPVLATAVGWWLLSDHPEQWTALVLLALLPGSALVPVWAAYTRACSATAVALSVLGLLVAALVALPLGASLLVWPLAAGWGALVARELVFLVVLPLGLGRIAYALLVDAFGDDGYQATIEPCRQTVLEGSLAILLCLAAARPEVAALTAEPARLSAPLAAVAFLYAGLLITGKALLGVAARGRRSRAVATAALEFMTTRHALLAAALLPLAVPGPLYASALAVPVFGFVVELAGGTAAVSVVRAPAPHAGYRQLTVDGRQRPSIMPE